MRLENKRGFQSGKKTPIGDDGEVTPTIRKYGWG